jgi:nucleoside-diphosphate-sugar epimerase
LHLIDHPEITGVYNAGFENISILDIAKMVSNIIPAEIMITPSNDPRSYRIDSEKLLSTGFKPKKTVIDAISEIINKYNAGQLHDKDIHYNLRWMEKTVFAEKI